MGQHSERLCIPGVFLTELVREDGSHADGPWAEDVFPDTVPDEQAVLRFQPERAQGDPVDLRVRFPYSVLNREDGDFGLVEETKLLEASAHLGGRCECVGDVGNAKPAGAKRLEDGVPPLRRLPAGDVCFAGHVVQHRGELARPGVAADERHRKFRDGRLCQVVPPEEALTEVPNDARSFILRVLESLRRQRGGEFRSHIRYWEEPEECVPKVEEDGTRHAKPQGRMRDGVILSITRSVAAMRSSMAGGSAGPR